MHVSNSRLTRVCKSNTSVYIKTKPLKKASEESEVDKNTKQKKKILRILKVFQPKKKALPVLMEKKSVDVSKGESQNTMRKEEAESSHPVIEVKDSAKSDLGFIKTTSRVGLNSPQGQYVEDIMGTSGDVNMEAAITSEDLIRAGGFGATDDISNFLPVASDSTDFEATLRYAREYEEPQEGVSRPGLGWNGTKEKK